MNQYVNEDVAWERLKDIQREMENSRLTAEHNLPAMWRLMRLLGERVWWIDGLAMRRAPRRHPAARIEEGEATSDAA